MAAGARVSGWRAFMLVAVVAAAVGGLVAMHHVSAAVADPRAGHGVMLGEQSPGGNSAAPGHDNPGHDGAGSAFLHLCMAVLTAAAAVVSLVVLAVMALVAGVAALRAANSGGRPMTRAPPLSTWARLSFLCVMRN